MIEVRELAAGDLRRALLAIDRSQEVDVEVAVVDGVLHDRPARFPEIPAWTSAKVDGYVAEFGPLVEAGAPLLVGVDGDRVVGVAIVDPAYDVHLAWLAFLHITRSHRRTGVGTVLWDEAARRARAAGATSMYVSAIPVRSTVDFYLSRGGALADPPRAELFEDEPEDIHLVCPIATR